MQVCAFAWEAWDLVEMRYSRREIFCTLKAFSASLALRTSGGRQRTELLRRATPEAVRARVGSSSRYHPAVCRHARRFVGLSHTARF